MIDLNIANIITVGLISVGGFAALVWLFQYFNLNTAWIGV